MDRPLFLLLTPLKDRSFWAFLLAMTKSPEKLSLTEKAREEREAAALRENLKRRKKQQQAWACSSDDKKEKEDKECL